MLSLLMACCTAMRKEWLSNGGIAWLNAMNWTFRNGPVMSCRFSSPSTSGASLKSIWLATSIEPVCSSESRTVSSAIVRQTTRSSAGPPSPVIIVGDEYQLDVLGPAIEFERPGADRRLPDIAAIRFQRGRADDPGGEDSEVARQQNRRPAHRDRQLHVAGRLYRLHVGEDDAGVDHALLVQRVVLIELAQEVRLDGGRIQRRPVMEGHAGTDREDVLQTVLRYLPGLRQGRLDLDGARLEARQPLGDVVDQRQDVAVAVRAGDRRVELHRRLRDGDDERLATILKGDLRRGQSLSGGGTGQRAGDRDRQAHLRRAADKRAATETRRVQILDKSRKGALIASVHTFLSISRTATAAHYVARLVSVSF